MLSCGRDPVEPVKWSFQHSPDSAFKDISYSEKFRIHNSSLIIYNVEAADGGMYNCTDATGAIYAIQLTVLGKPYKLFFFLL